MLWYAVWKHIPNSWPMFSNYLKLHLRTLWRNGTHTFVNVFGLSLGITCTIVIFLILRLELSFDRYHDDSDRIYRVVCEWNKSDSHDYSSGATYPLITAIKNDFPDAEHSVLLDGNMMPPVLTITREDGSIEKFKETKAVFVDPEYMKIFKQQWISGDTSALRRERTIVLTQSTAKKYFGNESPMNKVIDYNGLYEITVTGVVADPPLNTDLAFSFYMSNNVGAKKRGWEDWSSSSSSINCIVKLNPGVSKAQFDAKLKGWHRKYFTGNNEEEGKYITYSLQPLSEMHFDTRFDNFGGRIVSIETLYTLGLIGIVLLLTACINFINLNTVLIIDRSKEAGIRKVLGSGRHQIVGQFLGETLTITLLSMLISTGLVELALLNLTPVLGYRLEFHPFTDVWTMLFIVLLPIVVTGLAGLYPAISLSRFQPVKALKGKFASEPGKGLTMRRSLIVVQLIISQVLVVCTIIIVQQINFFMSQPLGINSHAVVEFELADNKPELVHLLRDRIKAIPGVENFSMSNTGATSKNQWFGETEATVNGKLVKQGTAFKIADEDYLDTYGIKLLYGKNLVRSDSATRFLVNKQFTKLLGVKDPQDAIGVQANVWGTRALITGVVNDYNVTSLHEEIQPTIIFCSTSRYYRGAVKLETSNMTETLSKVKEAWESIYPKYVYEQTFLDDTIKHFYDAEKKTSNLVGMFAGVAIFIGCIGLFGLISFMAKRKTKEIGIRKTLGASVTQVVGLFTKEFSLLVFISFVISVPLSYYFMDKWLDNFKYQIVPGVMTFSLGALLTFILVIFTIGLKSYRAATANPVNALRDE